MMNILLFVIAEKNIAGELLFKLQNSNLLYNIVSDVFIQKIINDSSINKLNQLS